MDAKAYYLLEVYSQLNLPLAETYPLVSLVDGEGSHSIGQHPMLMLVALTGAGKSTTLHHLRNWHSDFGADVIPSRREVADWITIPLAQDWTGLSIGAGTGSGTTVCAHAAVRRARRRRDGGGIFLAEPCR